MLKTYDRFIYQTFGNSFVGDAAYVAVPAVIGWMLGFPKTGALVGVGLSWLREERTGGYIPWSEGQ